MKSANITYAILIAVALTIAIIAACNLTRLSVEKDLYRECLASNERIAEKTGSRSSYISCRL